MPPPRYRVWLLSLGIAALVTPATSAAEPKAGEAKRLAFFEAKIRPVLVEHCYRCHSKAAGEARGGLALDTRESLRAGGDRGPAVVPGDPKASLLLTAISHADAEFAMPPKAKRLPTTVIDDFRTWIRTGAADPRETAETPALRPNLDLKTARQFWAYRKPVTTPVPTTKTPGWARRELDHFILARLEAATLAPSPDAKSPTLLRRLHFDLVGLPPSPDALERFSKQERADGFEVAWAAEVDRLLASPQFGERWGRHWLDVARFAESSGKEANMTFPYAWRYRDYVIDSFNADVPYDRFLTEQIAGDLLPHANAAERARLLVATGYLAVGPKNLDEADDAQFHADLIDEQIDAFTRGILGSSVACARCHDHKFDPYTMADYYALAGIFASTRTYFGTYVTPTNRRGGDPLPLPREAGLPVHHASVSPEQVAKWKAQQADLKKEQADGMAAIKKAIEAGREPEKVFTLTDALRIFWTLGNLEGQLEKVDDAGKALPLAMGVTDGARIHDAPLLKRGEAHQPGETVPRAFPRVFELPEAFTIPKDRSGRRELARWLTHPDHPLTARVMVNRIWGHLFGQGLVRTPDNFAPSGEPPTHPELLDTLARQFVREGWSVKRMVRELVLSRSYRQDSSHREAAFQADPENRRLWRMPKRRLDAEAIRDAMLAASGELDRGRPEGSLVSRAIGDRPVSLVGLDAKLPADLDGSRHRSVYLPILRDRLPDVLELFDFAESSLVTGQRETTNVPLQALYLMNSPFVLARAKALTGRVEREAAEGAPRVRRAFLLCLGREPDAVEEQRSLAFLNHSEGHDESQRPWAAFCQALLATAEFRNLD